MARPETVRNWLMNLMDLLPRCWKSIRASLLAALGVFLVAAAPAAGVDIGAWKEDFRDLKAAMADHYVNFEWAVERRGLDLPKLSAETERRIEGAQSDAEARAALRDFLRAFGDGHLGIRWPSPAPVAVIAEGQVKPASACASYSPRQRAPGVDFRPLRGFHSLDNAASRYFPAAVVDVPGYGRGNRPHRSVQRALVPRIV
jgi:hypothetical protein